MATVSPEDRRMLMDFFGVDSAAIDAMSDTKAMRGLQQYHQSGKLAVYDTSPPLPDTVDWVTDGLAQTASDIGSGVQVTGESIITSARQVGVGLADAVGVTSSLLKFIIPAGLILAGYIVFLRYGK